MLTQPRKRISFQTLAVLSLTAVLATACGGGGSSGASGTPAASTTFPLRAALTNVAAKGIAFTLTASGSAATQATNGSCTGSLSISSGPASIPASFEGQTVLSATSASSIAFTNCTPASTSVSTTQYYDSAYLPLGSSSPGVAYSVVQGTPALPASVKVGDSGTIGSSIKYANSSKASITGREDLTYAVEADASDAAIINLITKSYDASSVLQSTEQDRYRITTSGQLTPVSATIVFVLPSPLTLIFR